MKMNAFSPGLALMSSKIFSSTLYITSPSAGLATFTVLAGIGSTSLESSVAVRIGRKRALDAGGVGARRRGPPAAPVTAGHRLHHRLAHPWRQTVVGRD